MRATLACALTVLVVTAAGLAAGSATERPNILMIMTDDVGY